MSDNLADRNTPLRLSDGRLVYPGGRVVDPREQQHPELVEVLPNSEPAAVAQIKRRKLDDLPEQPRVMNVLSVVLVYTLYGLDDEEIGSALNCSAKQVQNMRAHEAYTTMHEAISGCILEAEADAVRDVFKQHSRSAANVIVDSLNEGRRADRLAAARDLLDRAGHRPADIIEHRHRLEGGLTIEVIRRDTDNAMPSITLDHATIVDGEP